MGMAKLTMYGEHATRIQLGWPAFCGTTGRRQEPTIPYQRA